jgi:hypothetical protein
MPIRVERSRLFDDSRTFSAEDLTEVWAWLDSFDSQPLRRREGEQLVRPPLTFHQEQYVFGAKTYSIAKCSDGRELLGSVISTDAEPTATPKWMPTALWSEVAKIGAVFSKSTSSGAAAES